MRPLIKMTKVLIRLEYNFLPRAEFLAGDRKLAAHMFQVEKCQ